MSSEGSSKPPDETIPFWGRVYRVPTSAGNPQSSMITPAVVAVLILLTAAFIAVSYYRVFGRYCHLLDNLFWRGRRDIFESTDVESGRISSIIKGLDEALIKKIPVHVFKSKKGLIDSTECVICLSEFRDCEKLRLLPKCSHAFHIRCIDMWLQSHPNCPLCRAPIISQTSAPPVQQILPANRRTPAADALQAVQTEHSVDHETSQAPPSSRDVEDMNENAEAHSRDPEEAARVSQLSQTMRLTCTCSDTESARGDESSLPRQRDYSRKEHPLVKLRRSNSTGSYFENSVAALDQETWHKSAHETSAAAVDDLSSALRRFKKAPSVLTDSPPFSEDCEKGIEPLSSGIVQLGSSSSSAVSLTDQTSWNHESQAGSQVEVAQEAGERSKPIGVSHDSISEHKLEVRELSSFSKSTMKRSFSGGKLFQLLQSKSHL